MKINFDIDKRKYESVMTFMGIAPSKIGYKLFSILESDFKSFPNGFPRHGEERKDLNGDCWENRLGNCSKTFRKYFRQIGIRYESELEYFQSKDKFQGKLYCSVLTKDKSRTFYYRN